MEWWIDKSKNVLDYGGETFTEMTSKINANFQDFLEQNLGLPSEYYTQITAIPSAVDVQKEWWRQFLQRLLSLDLYCRVEAEDDDAACLAKLKLAFSEKYRSTWYAFSGVYSIVSNSLKSLVGKTTSSINQHVVNLLGATSVLTKNNETPQTGDNLDLTGDAYVSSSSRTEGTDTTNETTANKDENFTEQNDNEKLYNVLRRIDSTFDEIYKVMLKGIEILEVD